MFPIHEKPTASFSFDRLDILWERYPQYHDSLRGEGLFL